MGMTRADAAKASPAAMMAPFVVTAAPVPSVMVTASAVSTAVVAVPMLDFNHATIRRGHWSKAQPGGSGYGHGQRSKQRGNNQNEASHSVFLPVA
jgi:hypothetical protein